jgi:cell shape-determining protein MreC
MSVYVNGNLIQTVSETYVGETNSPIQFGAYGPGNFYTGLIDDMRLYQSTLTATQILDIYNGL